MPRRPGPATDDIHEDKWESRLVRLVKVDKDNEPASDGRLWVVRDLLTERMYSTSLMNLSRDALCEMQVLAFVADAQTCSCCLRDGGRTFNVSAGDLCGVCYRNSCDSHGKCRRKKDL